MIKKYPTKEKPGYTGQTLEVDLIMIRKLKEIKARVGLPMRKLVLVAIADFIEKEYTQSAIFTRLSQIPPAK